MINELKKVNLLEFMQRNFDVEFRREGRGYVGFSPFRSESKASFYVSLKDDGHWVWFDHGIGRGGTIIDAVMFNDGHSDVSLAATVAWRMAETVGLASTPPKKCEYDFEPGLEGLLRKFSRNDAAPVRRYLTNRGISAAVADELISRRLATHNVFNQSSYCCFTVRNAQGRLRSMFNRKIDGPANRDKFLLGDQYPFCTDWESLRQASKIHVCESIIDALSLQTMKPDASVLAFPGVNYNLDRLDCLPDEVGLVECFDDDQQGRDAAARLKAFFPQRDVEKFDLHGAHDVNDLLCGKTKTSDSRSPGLSVKDRIDLVIDKTPSRKAASKYNVHHSRVCDIRKDAADILNKAWSERQPGRKASPAPPEDLLQLQRDNAEMKRQLDLLTMRREFLEFEVDIWKKRTEEAARQAQARKKKALKKRKG